MNDRRTEVIDAGFLTEMRRDMLRFATLQLRDDQLAEDVVQEAMMAALDGEKQFAGRSAVKTWVFAILRNKIVDVIRQKSRTVNFSAPVSSTVRLNRLMTTGYVPWSLFNAHDWSKFNAPRQQWHRFWFDWVSKTNFLAAQDR